MIWVQILVLAWVQIWMQVQMSGLSAKNRWSECKKGANRGLSANCGLGAKNGASANGWSADGFYIQDSSASWLAIC